MQFAHREIVKLKGEIRRRIGIGLLCVRKPDIESYGRRASVRCTAVRGFHDAGSAARRDYIVANAVVRNERSTAFRHDLPKAPCFLIPPPRTLPRPGDQSARWYEEARTLPNTTMVD